MVGCEKEQKIPDESRLVPAERDIVVDPPFALPPPVQKTVAPVVAAKTTPRPVVVVPEETPQSLERRYFARSTTLEGRTEIIRLLGLSDAAEAVDTMSRIFRAERHFESKMRVLEALNDMDWGLHGERKLMLLALAASASQPKLIRQSALSLLDERDDPRAVALIRNAMRDPDKEFRQFAAELYQSREDSRQ